MASKSLCFFFLVLCSPIFVSFSRADADLASILEAAGGGGGGGGGGDSLPCVQKLLPCQAYLKSSDTPPATCCIPLKEMVAGDVKCVCAVFNDAEILKGLNATQEDALNMAKHCGATADTSLCNKNATAPSGSTPSAPSSSNSSTANSSTPAKSSAAVNSYFGVREAAALLMSFLASSITF